MRKGILSYASEMEYFHYLKDLDDAALLEEFYICHQLKKVIKSRVDRVCRAVCNRYCPMLVDIAHEDITSCDYYLIRFLLRFEAFVKRQQQHINELHDYYKPLPSRYVKLPAVLTPETILRVYSELMEEFVHYEKIVSSFEEKTSMWMYFLYNKRSIPEVFKTAEYRDKVCAVNPDGSYDYDYQREFVYKELVRIVEDEMNCDISVFQDRRRRI